MVRDVTLGLALTLLAVPAWAEDVRGTRIILPSGAEAGWQETLHDDSGGQGVTHRFRFVIPDLAQRIPPPDEGAESRDDPEGSADADTEAAADAMVEQPSGAEDGDEGAQADPLHDDVVWLCQNWVLPRVRESVPRPRQIIISLSDKEVAFGTYDPDALQLFEAFALPADRDVCEWEPW